MNFNQIVSTTTSAIQENGDWQHFLADICDRCKQDKPENPATNACVLCAQAPSFYPHVETITLPLAGPFLFLKIALGAFIIIYVAKKIWR
jgi:hypothetical protein